MRRFFLPGSEWLYFKIYTGYKTGDTILIHKILPIISQLSALKLIDKWFFIRYSDPNFHIRLRFRVNDVLYYNQIFNLVSTTFEKTVDDGLISKIQCDSYNRELERYGDELIEITETFFCIDSDYILQLLKASSESLDPEKTRWCVSLRLIDDILIAFDFSLQNKRDFMLELSENFKKEFGFIAHTYTKQLNDKYRAYKTIIDNCFVKDSSIIEYEVILKQRIDNLKLPAKQIIKGYSDKDINPNEHINSLIHMTMNRLFRSSNRIYEMIIYDFLSRHYKSQCVRGCNSITKIDV